MMRSSNELDLDGTKQSGLQLILRTMRNKLTGGSNEVFWGKTSADIPCKRLVALKREVSAAHSGPDGGIHELSSDLSDSDSETDSIEDSTEIDWKKRHHRAYGMATSLYEQAADGKRLSGDPVADVFAIVARPNNCIIILADGVNWGEKARLAARSAVRGCMEYLNEHMFDSETTSNIMEHLLHSFQYAQKCVTNSEGTMTTLCAGVVCELDGVNKWGLCTLNVGDSLAFVYSKKSGLREVTIGSHLDVRRDLSNPGGSLGRVDGYNPDLTNLTCSFTALEAGDMVFLTSDGITDNFDPVISKPCPKEITSFNDVLLDSKKNTKETTPNSSVPEIMEFEQRHIGMINEMKEVFTVDSCPAGGMDFSAKELCGIFLTRVVSNTESKRLAHSAYAKYQEEMKRQKLLKTQALKSISPKLSPTGHHDASSPRSSLRKDCSLSSIEHKTSDIVFSFPDEPKHSDSEHSSFVDRAPAKDDSALHERLSTETSSHHKDFCDIPTLNVTNPVVAKSVISNHMKNKNEIVMKPNAENNKNAEYVPSTENVLIETEGSKLEFQHHSKDFVAQGNIIESGKGFSNQRRNGCAEKGPQQLQSDSKFETLGLTPRTYLENLVRSVGSSCLVENPQFPNWENVYLASSEGTHTGRQHNTSPMHVSSLCKGEHQQVSISQQLEPFTTTNNKHNSALSNVNLTSKMGSLNPSTFQQNQPHITSNSPEGTLLPNEKTSYKTGPPFPASLQQNQDRVTPNSQYSTLLPNEKTSNKTGPPFPAISHQNEFHVTPNSQSDPTLLNLASSKTEVPASPPLLLATNPSSPVSKQSRTEEAKLIKNIENAPGKLDHASIVSFQVGYFYSRRRVSLLNDFEHVHVSESVDAHRDDMNNMLTGLF